MTINGANTSAPPIVAPVSQKVSGGQDGESFASLVGVEEAAGEASSRPSGKEAPAERKHRTRAEALASRVVDPQRSAAQPVSVQPTDRTSCLPIGNRVGILAPAAEARPEGRGAMERSEPSSSELSASPRDTGIQRSAATTPEPVVAKNAAKAGVSSTGFFQKMAVVESANAVDSKDTVAKAGGSPIDAGISFDVDGFTIRSTDAPSTFIASSVGAPDPALSVTRTPDVALLPNLPDSLAADHIGASGTATDRIALPSGEQATEEHMAGRLTARPQATSSTLGHVAVVSTERAAELGDVSKPDTANDTVPSAVQEGPSGAGTGQAPSHVSQESTGTPSLPADAKKPAGVEGLVIAANPAAIGGMQTTLQPKDRESNPTLPKMSSDSLQEAASGSRMTLPGSLNSMANLLKSELRVGVQTQVFGHVTIQASAMGGQLSAQLSLEDARQSAVLMTHLPGVEQKLTQHFGANVSVGVSEDGGRSGAMSSGADQQRSPRDTQVKYLSDTKRSVWKVGSSLSAAPLQTQHLVRSHSTGLDVTV